MTGIMLAGTWEGARNEAFAEFILSSIATVTRIRRETDVGFDLLCTLLDYVPVEPIWVPVRGEVGLKGAGVRPSIPVRPKTNRKPLLFAGRAFGIQIKPSGHKIPYGGLDKSKKRWKKYEIDWLFSQDQPILIGTVDLENHVLHLFSAQRIWRIFNEIKNPGRIILAPNAELASLSETIPSSEQFKKTELGKTKDGLEAGDGFSYEIPLGKPMLTMRLTQYYGDDQSHRNKAREIIGEIVELEYRNIAYRQAKIAISEELEYDGQVWKYRPIYYSVDNERQREALGSIGKAITLLLHNRDLLNESPDTKIIDEFANFLYQHELLDYYGVSLLVKSEQEKL